jgi:type I site-specific restriction endonuclease
MAWRAAHPAPSGRTLSRLLNSAASWQPCRAGTGGIASSGRDSFRRGFVIFHPEDHARNQIDAALAAAGWIVQTRAQKNLGAGLGVAVREFPTDSGPVDYALFVGRELCGVIEAKPAGTTLSGFAEQAARYISDIPEHLIRREGQVRFEYVTSDNETLFRDHADPAPRRHRDGGRSQSARDRA